MKILYENNNDAKPAISIILIDWSCRESYHTLMYLNRQSAERNDYEIIWIEYYSRSSTEISRMLKEAPENSKPPAVDKWITLDMPDDVYYHKHLMYNVGIIASKGEVVSFLDSDAVVRPTFVESLIEAFEKNRDIVAHMDEARNIDRRFYPFNYPSIEEITGAGCINWRNGKTTGLSDTEDPLHARNYGACMSARKEDLVKIGGADEHTDYIGHICGPYEMTFRLRNAGKAEVWLDKEFLYHVWHPGADGSGNYLGPNDGRGMSSTALECKLTGRVEPLVENPAIKLLRASEGGVTYEPLIFQSIPDEDVKKWTVKKLNRKNSLPKELSLLNRSLLGLNLAASFFKVISKQFRMKAAKFSREPKSAREWFGKIAKVCNFLTNMGRNYAYVMERCRRCLKRLDEENASEFAIYGTGDAAETLYVMTGAFNSGISAVYDKTGVKKFHEFTVLPVEAVGGYTGKIVVASLVDAERNLEMLKRLGVPGERILLL